MKITSVSVVPYKIPYIGGKPLKWAAGQLFAAEHLLVRVDAEGGAYGVAEAVPRPMIYGETQQSIYYAIRDHLAPLVVGEDSWALERIWAKMGALAWNPVAKGAIDIALHDLNAKSIGLSIHRLLGGPCRDRVELAWMVGFGSNEEMLAEVLERIEEGFTTFKIKGGLDPDNDIRILTRIRERTPAHVKLYVDANMRYTLSDATRVLRALEGVLDCIEEPLPAWNEEARRELAQKVTVPLLGDDSVFTYADAYRQVRLGALQQIGIKMPRTGFHVSRKIAQLAELANVPVRILTQAESSLGTAAALQMAAAFPGIRLPCEMTFYLTVSDRVITEDPVIVRGQMLVPDKPGLGVEVDWDKLRRYQVQI